MPPTELIVDRAALPDMVTASARVTVVDHVVVAVDPATSPAAARRLSGTLLPGLVDLQVNGAGGRSVDEATPAALDRVAAAVFAGGAVAFLPTLITAPWPRLLEQVAAVSSWIGSWNGQGAEPLGLHVEGPFLDVAGAHDPRLFLDPSSERIEQLLAAAAGRLRLLTLSSARPGAAAATARLVAAGITVAIGHVAATTGLAECVAAGARLVTHLFNAMSPLHHREPGVAGQALDTPALSCALIVDGAHVHPTMVRNAFAILGLDRTVLVTDAVAAAGMADGDYPLAGARVTLRAGVVRDANGHLAGSALTMAQAARNFLATVETAGPWTLARVAAKNPAALVGAGAYGTIAVGKRAAFTLLGDDGSVQALRY